MEETPVLQVKINNLTTELTKAKKELFVKQSLLDQTREILKGIEDENKALKATLETVINSKKESPVRKVMGDLYEVIGNMKFQSPIVRKGS
tara:strand:- start:461 stop:733 length:273 start_codon:yes stop_codon:yes gene_type:complete